MLRARDNVIIIIIIIIIIIVGSSSSSSSSSSSISSSLGETIVLQAQTGPQGSRRLRFPDFQTISTRVWQVCGPYAQATITPRKYSWYFILLVAESTPGPERGVVAVVVS